MTGPQRSTRRVTSEWHRIQQPADDDAGADEPREQTGAKHQLLFWLVPHQRRKHRRHKKSEDDHQAEVTGHFRPLLMSNASSTTSMLRSPATMTNALPYS